MVEYLCRLCIPMSDSLPLRSPSRPKHQLLMVWCLALLLAGSRGNAQVQHDGPPQILQGPSLQGNGCVFEGQEVSFSVVAQGAEPLSYQWQREHTFLPGETNAVLRFQNVQSGYTGPYNVVVSNTLGSVVSQSTGVSAMALMPPGIRQQPASQTVVSGQDAVLLVQARAIAVGSCQTAVGYQWQHDGRDLPGATNAVLTIAKAELTDAGAYTVVVETIG